MESGSSTNLALDASAALDSDQPNGGAAAQPQALVIVTLLFFMWGFLTALNDVLIPHLKAVFTLSYVEAILVQFCFFGAYFIVSIPAGKLIRKLGYQRAAVLGLLIAAGGCFLFYPAASGSYLLFLLAFFILAAGITVLQVAANPYVTVLGPARTASSRLTLTQAFNSLGTTIAPLFGGWLILSASGSANPVAEAAAVKVPYLILASTLVLLALLFALARLPKLEFTQSAQTGSLTLRSQPRLFAGVIAIFLYVGAEVSIGSFLINFLGQSHVLALSHADAAHYVSYYWGGAMVGRFIGFAATRVVAPGKILALNASLAVLAILLAISSAGSVAMWALIAVGLCNSVMFPVIFSMALHQLGPHTGQASGWLCMAIVGGALVPFAQAALADGVSLNNSFVIPAVCYVYIAWFGRHNAKIYLSPAKDVAS